MSTTRLFNLLLLIAILASAALCQERVNRAYDLHIYYFPNSAASKSHADKLFAYAKNTWSDLYIKMFTAPIGPHPIPMFEIDIPQAHPKFSDILSWIMINRGNSSALLHPNTGDEMKDHTVSATWVGQPVPLNFEYL
ncbi:hypothetical protein AKO1_012357 [Acrasis kona]|uniref:DOPA 4,5-dioxygenase n=1 Tax=Acrasis kona TaxID=1008807 RepID=A0AAW2YW95_9EUKA